MKNPIKYPSYKDSEVEWLHEIPSHWKIVKAKRIFNEITIKNHPDEPLLAATQTNGVILKSLYENTTVTATKNFETLKFVRKGDFVISLRSFQGGIEYSHYQGIISPAYTILEPQEDVVHNYYRYLLKSKHYISGLALLVTGIREGQNIDTGKFKDSFLPLPSKEGQTAIANFLDFKLAKINRFILKKKQLIKLLNEQKAAIINQAVTKGLDPNAKMKSSGIEWLGDIPEHWEVRRLRFLLLPGDNGIKIGPFGSAIKSDIIHSKEFYISQGVKYFKIYGQEHAIASDFNIGNKYISEENYQRLSVYSLTSGDIIITMMGTIGKSKVVPERVEDGIMDSHLIRIGINSKTSSNYISFLINDSVCLSENMRYESKGSIMSGLNSKIVKSLYIPLPQIAEQQQIIDFIRKETTKINQTITTIEKEITLVEEYKTALIAEAVTGKIDLRDFEIPEMVEEESCEELEVELDLAAEYKLAYNNQEIE